MTASTSLINRSLHSQMLLLMFGLSVGFWFWLSKKKSSGRSRGLSFNTKVMMQGSFPENVKVKSPILSILLLHEKCPEIDSIIEAWTPMLKYDRFRSVFVIDHETNNFSFREISVDMHDQIVTWVVSSEEELKKVANDIANNELKGREKHPQWLINRVINEGKGYSAVIVQIHHSIGDGVSLVGAMEKCFRDAEGKPLSISIPEKKGNTYTSMSRLKQLWEFLKCIIEAATIGISAYDSDILFNQPDKQTMKMTESRKIIYLPTLRLEFVKALKNKCGGTVNDVLYSAFCGAVRRYCIKMGDPAFSTLKDFPRCRSLIPVAFPRSRAELEDMSRALSNRFAFVSGSMHLQETSAKTRLKAIMETMLNLRNTPAAYGTFWLQEQILALAPKFLQQRAAYDVFTRHTVVFSNVPGPQQVASFANQKICGIYPLFPNLLSQIIMVSFNGAVFTNCVLDDNRICKSELIGELFIEELRELAFDYDLDASDNSLLAPLSPGRVFGSSIGIM